MKILLEGYHDGNSGWEFDSPLMLVKPVILEYHVGSVLEADCVAEDVVDQISSGASIDDLDDSVCYNRRVILRDFRKAKKGSKRFQYWCQTVEIPDDIDWDDDAASDRVIYGPLQIGCVAEPAAA